MFVRKRPRANDGWKGKCMTTEAFFQVDFTIAGHVGWSFLSIVEIYYTGWSTPSSGCLFGCQKPLVDRTKLSFKLIQLESRVSCANAIRSSNINRKSSQNQSKSTNWQVSTTSVSVCDHNFAFDIVVVCLFRFIYLNYSRLPTRSLYVAFAISFRLCHSIR